MFGFDLSLTQRRKSVPVYVYVYNFCSMISMMFAKLLIEDLQSSTEHFGSLGFSSHLLS